MSQMVSRSSGTSAPRLNKSGYNCIARHVSVVFLACPPLFIGAGTLRWDWAWIFTVITFIGWMAMSLILARVNPELLNARGKRVTDLSGTKPWDWVILTIYPILLLITPFVAGLDYRNAWSSPTWDGIQVIGIVILVFSFIPLTWSMAVNRFFEGTVRIQTAREHRVVSSGPYRYVRHPGYVGVILEFVAVPLSLGTAVAWIPALLGVGLYVIRTWLEDRTLQRELPGYAEYAQHTRYRLLPGVW